MSLSSQKYGFGIRRKPIPDPGVKKPRIPDPDPQHWVHVYKNKYLTLLTSYLYITSTHRYHCPSIHIEEILNRLYIKISVVDPKPERVGSASFCRIRTGNNSKHMYFLPF
jgi:hypothetical protein